MPEACNEKEIFCENLIDIGCTQEQINDCLQLMNKNNYTSILKVLKTHRKELMDCIHSDQKKVDYLDYLVHKIEKINE